MISAPALPATQVDPSALSEAWVEHCAQALSIVRSASPLVQCLTNHVVSGFSANVLLALGASPAMVDIPVEAGRFAQLASAVLINLGTLAGEQPTAMREAARAASSNGVPWVLDPVAVGALPIRTALAHELLALHPSIVRGNPSEVMALAGSGPGGRGADSAAAVDDARAAAAELCPRSCDTVAVSGAIDLITDGRFTIRVHNSLPMLESLTGAGCSLGAVMAAYVGAGLPPISAATAATCTFTIAAERAGRQSHGPGSLAPALLDELAAVQPDDIRAHARLEVAAS